VTSGNLDPDIRVRAEHVRLALMDIAMDERAKVDALGAQVLCEPLSNGHLVLPLKVVAHESRLALSSPMVLGRDHNSVCPA
jgi:hypothetical protein